MIKNKSMFILSTMTIILGLSTSCSRQTESSQISALEMEIRSLHKDLNLANQQVSFLDKNCNVNNRTRNNVSSYSGRQNYSNQNYQNYPNNNISSNRIVRPSSYSRPSKITQSSSSSSGISLIKPKTTNTTTLVKSDISKRPERINVVSEVKSTPKPKLRERIKEKYKATKEKIKSKFKK